MVQLALVDIYQQAMVLHCLGTSGGRVFDFCLSQRRPANWLFVLHHP